jgi:DNA gyrase inhibitor GyrI
MNDLVVRIIRLSPMRVASVRVVSENPERDAWEKLVRWAGPKGLLKRPETHPVFGFNNPNPSPYHKEYGYEFWIEIGPDVEPEEDIEIKQFQGGAYAVATCPEISMISETYRALWDWVEANKHRWRPTHELEKLLNTEAPLNDLVMDLYLPIEG